MKTVFAKKNPCEAFIAVTERRRISAACTPLCMMNRDEAVERGQAVVLVTPDLSEHAIRPSLKALIGYSCGVLFVYHRVTIASLGSTHLIFILDMKARDSGISALYFSHRA